MEITVKDLWKALKKSFLFMLIGAVLVGGVFFLYTHLKVQKVYQSSAKFFLSPQSTQTNDTATLNNDLVVGGKVIGTLGSYLMTEETMASVLRFVEERHAQIPGDTEYVLENKYTASSLLRLFTFVAPDKEDTNLVFEVKCKAYSPHDAKLLLNAFGSIINERASLAVLQNVYLSQTIAAPKNGSLIYPNLTTNTLIGLLLGAVIPYAIVLVLAVLDTRIKTEEDVKTRFKHPILGQIPHL